MAEPRERPHDALLADWLTIWQSEWAAVAVDREVQEAWLRWAGADAAFGPAGAVPPPRTPAAADAPDAGGAASASIRDAAVAELLDRVAELERRLAAAAAAGR